MDLQTNENFFIRFTENIDNNALKLIFRVLLAL